MPALAGEFPDRGAPSRLEPEAFFRGMIRDSDVDLLFDEMRRALLAAAEGRDAPPSPALEKRVLELGAELRLRGTVAGLAALNALEANVRQMLREAVPPPRRRLPPAKSPVIPIHD